MGMIQREINRSQICDGKQAQWAPMIMTGGTSAFPPGQTERERGMVGRIISPRTGFRVDWPVNDFAAVCVNLKVCFLIKGNIFSTYGWRK
jgi:hypothetical protein